MSATVTAGDPQPESLELYCPECDYDLTGAPGPRCPWCGWLINIAQLKEQSQIKPGARRMLTVSTATAVALLALLAISAIGLNKRATLTNYDYVALGGVLLAALGHLVVMLLAIRSGQRWPIRNAAAGRWARVAGLLAVAAGVIGALPMLRVAPSPRFVRGVQVNGVVEFLLSSAIYSIPGITLFLLGFLVFRRPRPRDTSLDGESRSLDSELAQAAPFDVLFWESVAADRVAARLSHARRSTTPAVESAISRTWEAEVAVAEPKQRTLFDGRLLRLIDYFGSTEEVQLHLGWTTYREFLGTNAFNASLAKKSGPDCLANPLGISAVVRTSDGMLVFGRRNDSVVLHAGYLHCIGGLVDETDVHGDSVDVVGAMRRELLEEMPIAGSEITGLRVVGIVRDRAILQPELVFDARIDVRWPDLRARFDRLREAQEHARLEAVPDRSEAIGPFLVHSAPVAPVSEAAVLVYGKGAWGSGWYDATCLHLYGEVPRPHHPA